MQNKYYLFDFDSTFIQTETLEVLAEIGLTNHPEKNSRMATIHQITELTMKGQYSFQDSLRERIPLLNLTASHLEQAIECLKQKITPSFARNIDFFKKNADSIFILSGGFIELIWPIAQAFGLRRDHIFANRFLYDFEGNVLGYDERNPLAQDQGKVKVAHQLQLQGDILIVGDGYTDYEVKEAGIANTFVAFTENITRESVTKLADIVVNELEGLFFTCQIPYISKATHQKVLLLENLHPVVVHYFKNQGYEVESLQNALPTDQLLKKLEGVSVLGIRSKTEVTADIIDQSPTLEAIGAFCIGTNQIDLKRCSEKGIAAFNAPFSNTRSVVELAIGEIILLARRAVAMNNKLFQGQWHKSSQGAHEVRGKTLGIIGYGNIGTQLSIIAEALGMRVLFYDIEDKLPLGNARSCHSLEELLNLSDIVSVHVDGRQENRHLIGSAAFAMMKPGVIFLNLSRGFVVDYDALTREITAGKIAGVGIDVYPEEPHQSKSEFKTPLQQFENAFITPHIGGSTEEAQQSIGEYVSKNLHAYMADGASTGSVNFPQLYLPTMNYPQRIIHIHQNVPGILAKINGLFAEHECNIEGQFLKTNDKIGYVITDLNHEIDGDVLTKLHAISRTIKVRILNKSL